MTTVNAALTGFPASTAAQSPAASVDYQSFIKLLVAELSNQDPLAPMDATQHVTQLASFSNVEQTLQINRKISGVLEAANIALAGSIVGRTLTTADGTTTGVIRSVAIQADGLVATLENGATVPVTEGIVIGG